jgi:outer membrane autotransporter protein
MFAGRTAKGWKCPAPTSAAPTRYFNRLRNPRHMAGVSRLALMIGSTALVGTTLPSAAADATWTGATSTNWFTTGNWDTGVVPIAGGVVWIDTTVPNPAVVNGANAVAGNVIVGVTNGGTGALTITNGGTLSGYQGSVGWDPGSTGAATVTGAGSAWINSDNFHIGSEGTGTLTVSNGGAVSDIRGFLGLDEGSNGTATITGAGSTWTNSGGLEVGRSGTGTLTISNGGAVSSDAGYVGENAGGIGTITVTGAGSTWTNTTDLFVGWDGAGMLTIAGGGAVSNAAGIVGAGAGSTGAVTVDGAGSTWTNSANLTVGWSGTGILAISNGGTVHNQTGYLGNAAGSTGTATVDGPGSTWINFSDLRVGNSGAGWLTITNGGAVDSLVSTVGSAAGASGIVTVDGASSAWTSHSSLYVGENGTGTLVVSNGGSVSNTNGHLGYGAGSIGVATVDGAGSTWTSSSVLLIGESGTGTVTISNGGTVSAGGGVTLADLAGSIGTLNIGGAAGSAATGAGVFDPAALQFGVGVGALNFSHTETNYAFGASISGLGTINQIAGTTTLTADSSGFTGATNLSGGRLAVNGSLANSLVTITGGVLGGNGMVGGIVAQSGGIIGPGNSIDTLNVAGDVTQAAGSIYQVELTSTGQSDLIKATGTATIAADAVLDVVKTDAGSYVLGTHYTVLQADGGVTGTYTLNGAGPFIGLLANYDDTHVYLDVVQAKSFAAVGLTSNQIAAGGGAESVGAGNPLFNAIMDLPTEAIAQAAFDQLSGEIHASAKGMLLEDSRFIRDAASNRISAAFGDVGAAPLPVMAYGEGGPETVGPDTDRFAVWGQAFGSWGNTGSDGNAAAFDRSTGGLLAGADGLVGGWRVGLIGGYSHSSFDADARQSSGDSDNYHLGLYGGTNWGAIAFRTGAAYSWDNISTKRSVAFNGFADALSADYDAATAQVFGELAYKVDANRLHFEPFANLAYVDVKTDGFTEKGSAAALTSQSSNTDATFTTLGLRASTGFTLADVNATGRGMVGWRHAFGDVAPTSTFAFAGGDAFTIAGVPVAKDSAVIEAGFDLQMSANATLGLSYAGQFGSHAADNGARANLNVRF